jgi:endo-1,4-beta-xylanase
MKDGTLISRRVFLKMGALAGAVGFSAPFGHNDLWAQILRGNRVGGVLSGSAAVGLRYQAERAGMVYGAAAGVAQLKNDKAFAAHFIEECGILVPENELKWGTLRPAVNSYDFAPGDWLASFAQANNLLLRGHTLVWHENMPAWFSSTVNKKNAGTILQEHITTVVTHYAGKIHSWDVVNEAICLFDGLADGMRNTPWYQFLGPGYVETAFRYAAAADPEALLVLNQNHLAYDAQCRSVTLSLLKKLRTAGAPIHALGIQAHLTADNPGFDPGEFRSFLHDVASLGLKILITEMDVADRNLPYDLATRDQIVAKTYSDFLTVVLREPSVIALLTWGLSDKYSWLADEMPRPDGAAVRPLPLDATYRRKLAWDAIAAAFASRAASLAPGNLSVETV